MNPLRNASANAQDEINVVETIRVLWKGKIAIAVISLLFCIGSIYYAMTATHVFSAQTVVTRASQNNVGGAASLASQFGGLASLAGVSMPGAGAGREAQAILESRKLIEEFIKRHDLLPVLSPEGDDSLSLWLAVKQFQELVLSIREDSAEGTTIVAVQWTDPEVAAAWANQFIDLANEIIRTRAQDEAAANVEYLNGQIERTNVVEIQNVMYNLIENEMKTMMLANARAEYAFTVVDPAVAPEIRSSPNRKLIVVTGTVFGALIAVIFVLLRNLIVKIRSND
ncbi:MAG: Wzz/FepE/Etk N-terminal domain-containing protein [Woeseiaceae bacterium]